MTNDSIYFIPGVPKWVSLTVLFIIALWSLYWKARAMWIAAKKDDLAWFLFFLIINTVGIAEIVYIFWIVPRKQSQ